MLPEVPDCDVFNVLLTFEFFCTMMIDLLYQWVSKIQMNSDRFR